MSSIPLKPFTSDDAFLIDINDDFLYTSYKSFDGFKIKVNGIWGLEYYSPTGRLIYKGHHSLKLLLRVIRAVIVPSVLYEEAVESYKTWYVERPKVFLPISSNRNQWRSKEGDRLVCNEDNSFTHFDPEGNAVKTYPYLWDATDDHQLMSDYYHRVNRLKSGAVLNEGHLVPGTRFRTEGLCSERNSDEHVVHSVCTNNPGHWLVKTTTVVPCIITKQPTNDIFAISFISEILSRPAGKPVVEGRGVMQDAWNLPSVRVESASWDKMYSYLSNVDTRGVYVDPNKAFKRLKAMALLQWTPNGYAVKDPKAAGKFLARNPHWVLHTMSHSRYEARIESEIYSDSIDEITL